MAVCWQDIPVVERVTFDGQQQREALGSFQKAAGLDATTAAQRIGLSYPQYNRYLWGRVPLRTDQITLFAAAYGITKAALTRALGLMDDFDLRAELGRIYAHAPDVAERVAADFADAPPDMQELAAEMAAEVERPSPEQRADDRPSRTGT